MPTLLCVPITVNDLSAALRDARQAKDLGADLVEFRLDDFFHGEDTQIAPIVRLLAESPLPCIATCRISTEGGHYDGPEDARVSLFERLGTAFGKGEHPPRFIDVEHSAYTRSANIRQKIKLAIEHPEQVRDLQTSLILSTHDFNGRPADLTRRIIAMQEQAAAKVLKIAFRARSLRDNLELFDLLAHRDRPMIALGMGEFGLMSRILAPKFGGFLTFAALRSATTTAPGQPTVSELLDLYRFRFIGPETAVYGVVGHPVSHSLSPHIHNAGFESTKHDGVYLPLPVPDGYESLKATVLELIHHVKLNLRGLSITLPHKENMLRLAREQGWSVDEFSTAIGAANTLSIQRARDGSPSAVEVRNTDAPALLQSLTDSVGDIAGKNVAIIGAGGAARAAAYICAKSGGLVTVYNRTYERAEALAASLNQTRSAGINAKPLAAFSPSDIVINCTPTGMKDGPAPDAIAIPLANIRAWKPGAAVMDTVYRPIETPLLRAAREAGLRTVDGVSMFVNQAAAQFTLWTGHAAPVRLFDRIVREHA